MGCTAEPAECVVHLGRSHPREDPSCSGPVPTAKTTLNPANVSQPKKGLAQRAAIRRPHHSTFNATSSPAARFGPSGSRRCKPGSTRPLRPDEAYHPGLCISSPVPVAEPASVAEAFAGTALGETAEAGGTAACLAGFAGLAPFVDLCPGFRPQAWAAIRARAAALSRGTGRGRQPSAGGS